VAKVRILIVDDEKNIRLAVAQSVESLGLTVDTAVNGEEALEKIKRSGYQLVLLDLKLPGMDGMAVLRQIRSFNRDVKILIITAHGTVENAVEAMKLGAVDFVQKPFTPDEIRGLVSRAISRRTGFLRRLRFDEGEAIGRVVDDLLLGKKAGDLRLPVEDRQERPEYATCLEQAKAAVEAYDFDSAASWAQRAIAVDSSRADAYNFLGVLFELRGDKLTAQKYYRAALALDPTFAPAKNNLSRSTQVRPEGRLDLGGQAEAERRGIHVTVSRKPRKRG
jgi:DNA-binding response OmpR family regulator